MGNDLGATGHAAIARLTRETEFRGRVVARQVCEPLEAMLEGGLLTSGQYEAGRRLRAALGGSWPRQTVCMRWGYASDASDLDDEGDPIPEDEAWMRRAEHHATWRAAERLIGPECWPWVSGLCRGYWLGSRGRADLVRRGLGVLVKEWRLTR